MLTTEIVKQEEQNAYLEKGKKIKAYSRAVQVNPVNAESVRGNLQKVKNVRLDIEKDRKRWKEPFLESCQAIDAIAKELSHPITSSEQLLNNKLNLFNIEQERTEREIAEKAKAEHRKKEKEKQKKIDKMKEEGKSESEIVEVEAIEEEKIIKEVNAITTTVTKVEGGKKTLTAEIVDEDKVPRSLCKPAMPLINAFKKKNKSAIETHIEQNNNGEHIIDGIRYFYKIKY